MNETKKCLACNTELKKNKRFYCKDKCQREYSKYLLGKKKKEEMFEDLRGKKKYSIHKKKEKKGKKSTWRKYRYYINRPFQFSK